jgi:acyl carrier protein
MNEKDFLDILTKCIRRISNDSYIDIDIQDRREDIPSWTSLNHMLIIAELEIELGLSFSLQEAIDSSIGVSAVIGILKEKVDSKIS